VTAGAAELPIAGSPARETESKRRLPLLPVEALLRAQQTLTAVERFSRLHDEGGAPAQAKYYKDLLPTGRPGKGEQYAFEVDLDACTWCKACVAGCHSMNGLDGDEVWRTVGLLQGGGAGEPFLQTVTTSCHHCVEPACMAGCPVQAYQKDPVTGIVKHLDDQCFGCQYCTLMCPYDAPKYNAKRGVVRKCDMCSDRLAHGEAPACVQACPNEAIAIRIVDQAAVIQVSDAQRFLPGAPAPDHTLPTTRYKTARATPQDLLPADFYRTAPEHSHPPLVVMLTLTQLSVGAFIVSALVERVSGTPAGSPLVQTVLACGLAVVALGASVLHLGRPWLAWRAVLGLRTSWLSREALVLGLFAQLALLYGAVCALPLPAVARLASRLPVMGPLTLRALPLRLAPALQMAAVTSGALGVFCSVMVYVATKRPQWSGTLTSIRFFGTTFALGAAAVLAVCVATAPALAASNRAVLLLPWLVAGTTSTKLLVDGWVLSHARARQLSVHKRAATVMLGDLRTATSLRLVLGAVGGVVLPTGLAVAGLEGVLVTATAWLALVLLTVAELCERYLFFAAAPASRMPGSLS
jgi:formate dehydrogenase iron-sulfur subunit